MSSQRHNAPPLNYFQQSPVRGQLERPEGYSTSGWRYLQCTDTPNELRILLPPRTAQIYGHLLRAEANELSKDKNASWDRILQIRHLKDRMIRKCQRMARASAPAGKQSARSMFFTVHAPPDFRLKEMERWFKMQGPQFAQDTAERVAPASTSYCCDKCGPQPATQSMRDTARRGMTTHQGGSQIPRRATAPSQRHPPSHAATERVPLRRTVSSSQTTLLNPSPPPQDPRQQAKQQTYNAFKAAAGRVPSVVRDAGHVAQARQKTMERKRSTGSDASIQSHSARLKAKSPDPLPIPFRTQDDEPLIPFVSDSPSTLQEDLPPSPSPPKAELFSESPTPSPPNGQALPTIHEGSEGRGGDEASERPLPRRRSSLKKCNSISRLSVASNTKSVAWAMDRDWIEQMSQYMKAANEAEVLGHELEDLRTGYQQEVEAMKKLCRNVSDASERIRLEMEKLQRDEEAVRKQENRLLFTIEQLEQKETQFRDKVLSVLEETKRVVNLCDKKREIHEL